MTSAPRRGHLHHQPQSPQCSAEQSTGRFIRSRWDNASVAILPPSRQEPHDAHLYHCCRNGLWFGGRMGRPGAIRGLIPMALVVTLASLRAIGVGRRVGGRLSTRRRGRRAKITLIPMAVGLLLQINIKGRWYEMTPVARGAAEEDAPVGEPHLDPTGPDTVPVAGKCNFPHRPITEPKTILPRT
jgi:hypothetical protein